MFKAMDTAENQVDHKYYVGSGKLAEIQDFIEFHDIDVIVANDELTTAQSKKFKCATRCENH